MASDDSSATGRWMRITFRLKDYGCMARVGYPTAVCATGNCGKRVQIHVLRPLIFTWSRLFETVV
eukprot:4015279-Prymnesium_polylepis.1